MSTTRRRAGPRYDAYIRVPMPSKTKDNICAIADDALMATATLVRQLVEAHIHKHEAAELEKAK